MFLGSQLVEELVNFREEVRLQLRHRPGVVVRVIVRIRNRDQDQD